MQFSSALPFWAPEWQMWFFNSFCRGDRFLSLLRSPTLGDFPLLTELKSTVLDETKVSHCCLTELVENHRPRILLEDVILSKPTKNLKTDVKIKGLLRYVCSGAHCSTYRAKGTEVMPKARMWQTILVGKKTPKIRWWGVEELPAKTRSDQLFLWEDGKLYWEKNPLEAVGAGADSSSPVRSTKLHQNISNTAWGSISLHSDFLFLFQVMLFVWIILGFFKNLFQFFHLSLDIWGWMSW